MIPRCSPAQPDQGRFPVEQDVTPDAPHCVYLISRFASEANRRLMRVLTLDSPNTTFIVVQEKHRRRVAGVRSITIPRRPQPSSLMRALGLRRLAGLYDQTMFFPCVGAAFAHRAAGILSQNIREDLAAGRRVTVMTFVPDLSTLHAGASLKAKFPAVNWIVDCQIVYALDDHHLQRATSRRQERVLSFEATQLAAADTVVVESEAVKQALIDRHSIAEEKIIPIPNAFGAEDWMADTPRVSSGRPDGAPPLRLGFLGSFFKPPKVPGEHMLQALEAVRARGIDVTLTIIGDKYLDANPSYLSDRPWVEHVPRLPHAEALQRLRNSDALLLFLAPCEWANVLMHAKLPYYMAAGLPILAIVPARSNTADIVSTTGTGAVVDSADSWEDALTRCLGTWRATDWQQRRNSAEIRRYAWDNVQRLWLRILSSRQPG